MQSVWLETLNSALVSRLTSIELLDRLTGDKEIMTAHMCKGFQPRLKQHRMISMQLDMQVADQVHATRAVGSLRRQSASARLMAPAAWHGT
jgi:hypothetical protein